MTKRGILFAMTIFPFTLAAATRPEVIDLGSLKVEGAARGPEVRLIDGGRLDSTTSENLVFGELEGVERRMLGLEAAPAPLPVVKSAKRGKKGSKP